LGKVSTALDTSRVTKSNVKFEQDIVASIETNVDDVTGEVLAQTIERAMAEGAFDASVTPFLGKKGRPGQTVRVVCSPNSIAKFARLLVEETGTMGVKVTKLTRLIVPRREASIPFSVGNFKGTVKVKIAKVKGRIRIKPELSEAKIIAEAQNVPLREVVELISIAARQRLVGDP
jgi:uncharacterized protein (DUF111 family)